MDVQSGETEEEEVMGEGIGKEIIVSAFRRWMCLQRQIYE